MPNYLQRIAVSGARTASSPAKPAVSAPPIMPHPVAPERLPTILDTSRRAEALPDLEFPPLQISPVDEVVSNRQSAAQPPDPASAGDTPSRIAPAADPQSREQINQEASTAPQEGAVPDPVVPAKVVSVSPSGPAQSGIPPSSPRGPRINAPKGLRGAAQGREQSRDIASAIEHTLDMFNRNPIAAATRPAHSEPPLRLDGETALHRFRRTAEALLHGESEPNPFSAAAAESPVATGDSPGRGPALEARPQGAVIESPNKVEQAPLPETVTRGVEDRTSAVQLQPSAGQWMSRPSPPARSKSTLATHEQDQDARGVGIQAVRARQAVTTPVPGPAAAGRRSKISIGRIDVQVNNTPAAAEPRPALAVPADDSNFLEVRYLNRFSLKP